MRYLATGAAVITISLLAACASKPVTPTVPESYLASWQSSLNQHQIEYSQKDSAMRSKLASQGALEFYSWDDYAGIAQDINRDLRLLHEPAGRETMRKSFIDFMKTNPPTSQTSEWFKTQASNIDAELNTVVASTEDLLKERGGQQDYDARWLHNLEQVSIAQGKVIGKARELFAVYEDAGTYYTEMRFSMSEGKDNTPVDLQQTQLMVSLAGKLQQADFQKMLTAMLEKPHNCVKYESKLTCN